MVLESLPSAMLATLGGLLALPFGLAVLLLPLLATELSRPRDSFWGAVVLLQGLVLVTTADRLSGAPMLAVLCGALLLGRLGLEVGQARWRQLTPEEQQRLGSWERWSTSLRQLGATLAGLGSGAAGLLQPLRAGVGGRAGGAVGGGAAVAAGSAGSAGGRSGRAKGKRWVRPEGPAPEKVGEKVSELAVEGPQEQMGAELQEQTAEQEQEKAGEKVQEQAGEGTAEPQLEMATEPSAEKSPEQLPEEVAWVPAAPLGAEPEVGVTSAHASDPPATLEPPATPVPPASPPDPPAAPQPPAAEPGPAEAG
jgi:hypothetical protein